MKILKSLLRSCCGEVKHIALRAGAPETEREEDSSSIVEKEEKEEGVLAHSQQSFSIGRESPVAGVEVGDYIWVYSMPIPFLYHFRHSVGWVIPCRQLRDLEWQLYFPIYAFLHLLSHSTETQLATGYPRHKKLRSPAQEINRISVWKTSFIKMTPLRLGSRHPRHTTRMLPREIMLLIILLMAYWNNIFAVDVVCLHSPVSFHQTSGTHHGLSAVQKEAGMGKRVLAVSPSSPYISFH